MRVPKNRRESQRIATIRDVAHEANVSIATVSHVLNGRDDRVSEATKRRVLEAIKALNYRPPARVDMRRRTLQQNIGVLVEDLTSMPITKNAYFGHILEGVIENAALHAWSTTVYTERMWQLGTATAIRRQYDGRCDALIVIAPKQDGETLQSLHERNVTMVSVGSRPPYDDVAYVDIDNEAVARQAVELFAAHGHRRIAYLAFGEEMDSSQQREAAFVAEANARGLTPYVLARPSNHESDPFESTWRSYLAIPETERPTAWLTWNDEYAGIALRGLRNHGLYVPRDISLLGIDGTDEAWQLQIGTFRQPLVEIGRTACAIAIEQMLGQTSPSGQIVRLFEAPYVPGDTLAPPPSRREQ